jgi:hypothetical protein
MHSEGDPQPVDHGNLQSGFAGVPSCFDPWAAELPISMLPMADKSAPGAPATSWVRVSSEYADPPSAVTFAITARRMDETRRDIMTEA